MHLTRGFGLASFFAMEENEIYPIKDLVGCEVLTVQGESLGSLCAVLATGANDVFVIGEGASEVLIPALKTVVLSIDVSARRILVDLPAGLREEKKL